MAIGTETSWTSPTSTSNSTDDTSQDENVSLDEQLIASLPSSINVDRSVPNVMRIKEDWFRWHHAVLLFGLMLIVGPVVILAPGAELTSTSSSEEMPIAMIVGFGLAIVCGAYWALAGMLNTTKITASSDSLERKIGPLPWPGYFQGDSSSIDQLYVTQGFTSQRRMTPWDWDGDQTTERSNDWGEFSLKYSKKVPHYKLVARLKNGKVRTLSIRYESPYIPRVLERLLENHIGIADTFVAAEFRGDP